MSILHFVRFTTHIKIPQKPPSTLLLPPLLTPSISFLWEEFDDIVEARIVRYIHEDVVVAVELAELIDALLCLLRVLMHAFAGWDVKRLSR